MSTSKIGNEVLVRNDLLRNHLRLGMVQKAFLETDGLVRSVNVRTSDGTNLRRAIEKLYPLEIYHEPEEPIQEEAKRPKRASAIEAQIKVQEITH